MKKEIIINEDKLTVIAEIEPIGLSKVKIKYLTSDIQNILEKENYKIKNVLLPSMITNVGDNHLKGTWIFQLDIPKEIEETIILSEKGMEQFIEALSNPPEPNENLKKLLKKSKKERVE